MNRSKVKVGEDYSCRPSKYSPTLRVRVLDEVELQARPYGPFHPGFRVEVIETERGGHAVGAVLKVMPREIFKTWDEHVRDEREAAEREARARVELREQRTAAVLERQQDEQRLYAALKGRGPTSARLLDDLDVRGPKVYSFSITELADLIAEAAR